MVEINNKAEYSVDIEELREAAEKFLQYYKKQDLDVSIALVDDADIREMNRNYRGLDKPTDVLAFPASEEEQESDGFLGEVIIDNDQVSRQAPHYSHTPREELVFILIHGLLHLLGYSDYTEEDKEHMIQLGKDLIKRINLQS